MIPDKGIIHPIIIKLGGSVITIKNKPYTPNIKAIEELANIISNYVKRHDQAVLVHGGGSYGHYAVAEARDKRGVLNNLDIAHVQFRMLELSLTIARKFIEAGVPVSIHPAHTLCSGYANCCFNDIIEDLTNGLIPMTYGDILATDRGHRIISGDDLALWIASTLGAKKVIFVMDKPGVLDETGQPIRFLSPSKPAQILNIENEGFDVTGGIERKIKLSFEFIENYDIEIRLVDINGLKKILKGEEAGTLITK